MPWHLEIMYDLSVLCSVLTWLVYIVFIMPAEKSSFREEKWIILEWNEELCLHQIDEITVSDSFLLVVL